MWLIVAYCAGNGWLVRIWVSLSLGNKRYRVVCSWQGDGKCDIRWGHIYLALIWNLRRRSSLEIFFGLGLLWRAWWIWLLFWSCVLLQSCFFVHIVWVYVVISIAIDDLLCLAGSLWLFYAYDNSSKVRAPSCFVLCNPADSLLPCCHIRKTSPL